MNPILVRNLYYPLSQMLQREHARRCLQVLERTQWLDAAEHERRLWDRLRSLLPAVADSVPFYRMSWADAGIDAQEVTDWAGFQQLPLLTRENVRSAARDLEAAGFPGGRIPTQTSGSSGIPLRVYHSRAFRSWHEASQWRARHWFGVDVGDPTAVLWPRPVRSRHEQRVLNLKYRLNNILPLSTYDVGAAAVREDWYKLGRFRPRFIYAYPSALAELARQARGQGLSRLAPAPRLIMTSCEMLAESDRSAIEEWFGSPVSNVYGSAEFGSFAHQCPEGGMHVSTENVLVEVLRGGQSVVGEPGDLVVTSLHNEGMPLIRYAIGDIGTLLPGSCACGRGLPRLALHLGKTVEMIRTVGGRVLSAAIFDYVNKRLMSEGHVAVQFKAYQRALDEFHVQLVPGDSDVNQVERVLREVLAAEVGEVRVRVETVDRLPRDSSGKLRYFVSELAPGGGPGAGPTPEPESEESLP